MDKNKAFEIAVKLLREIDASFDASSEIQDEEFGIFDTGLFFDMLSENPELLNK